MLEAELKSKIDKLWDLFWSGGIANPLTAIEQISYLLFMKRLDDKDIKQKKDAKFAGKTYQSIFKNNNALRWSHWKHFEAEEMLNHVRDKVFPFIKKLNSNSENGFSAQMKDAVFIIPKPSLLVQAVEIIESLKIHEQNQDTQGDIYEYLLSELKTSGKNGQFRTPRHIIKMMCELVAPNIGQSVCDPACGTGGFLIGAYQHILRQHTSPELVTVDERDTEHGLIGDKITSAKIWKHLKSKTFYGFDFDSTMLRISAMNMALHGIQNPNIKYLDSISKNNTEENLYDVILANPPFKGNIDKNDIHEALSRIVKTTRTELLFVAQMMRLLKIGGQCAVIVPNGVLFRSDKAHTAIRKKIIEEAQLEAVISMPSGVFKPYAGVSTAVLVFAKGGETDKVWFYDMTADGFSLDDKRDKIKENDIPDIIEKWNQRKKLKEPTQEDKWFFTNKKKIVESGDYSLNGKIYKETVSYSQTKWPMMELGEVCNFINGKAFKPADWEKKTDSNFPIIRIQNLNNEKALFNYYSKKVPEKYIIRKGDLLFSWSGSRGTSFGPHIWSKNKGILNQHIFKVEHSSKYLKKFLYLALKQIVPDVESNVHGAVGLVHITKGNLEKFKIPLPPLEVQKEIVDEIEGYQKIIDGAKQVVDNWRPNLKIDPSWSMVELGSVSNFVRGPFGGSLKKEIFKPSGYLVYEQYHAINNNFNFARYFIDEKKFSEMKRFEVFPGDLLISCSGTMGKVAIVPEQHKKGIINQALLKLTPHKNKLYGKYLQLILQSNFIQNRYFKNQAGSSIENVSSVKKLKEIKIPVPSLELQKNIISEIEKEKNHLESCKELIKINSERIRQKINEL